MKSFEVLLALTVVMAGVLCPSSASAADTAQPAGPATVVPQGPGNHDLQRDLRGVPDGVKNLILTFDQTRDKYLQQQNLLRIRLHQASTAQEQQQLRQQLQANRQDFITDLKSFRDELHTDLQALRGKISHAEFGRIIDAAHTVGTEGGHRHRGQ